MSDEWRVVCAGCGKSRFLAPQILPERKVRAALGVTMHGGFGGLRGGLLGLGWWLGGRSCASRAKSLTPEGVSYSGGGKIGGVLPAASSCGRERAAGAC